MFPFIGPCTISLTGQTGSGKTHFIKRLLQNKGDMFKPEPSEVLYCYGVYQKAFEEMEKEMPFLSFHKGLPNAQEIDDFANLNANKMIVCDDLMEQMVKSSEIEALFTRNSHHKNLTVVYINQNLYCPGKHSRTINLNTHYLILMRNPRDVSTMSTLGRQLGIGGALCEAYKDVHKKPFSYLVLDMSPYGEDQYKLRTNIFKGEDTIIYKV